MTDRPELLDELATALPRWLPSQRWFAGKDRPVTAVRPLASTVVLDGDPLLLHVVVEVVQDDRAEPYQLLVGHCSQPPDVSGASWITTDPVGLYEASGDADLTGVLLAKMIEGAQVGTLRFDHEPGAELEPGLRARPITSEQSNTSLVYGSRYILKLFRKLSTGENKDLVLHRALRDVGSTHIAKPLGSITGELAGEPVTVGMLQQFLPDAVDGWAMATTSVRDLMAAPSNPEDPAAQPRPDEVGGDFAGEAERLGASVAEVHGDLARALGTEPVDDEELDRTVKAMLDRLDAVAEQVPELAPHVPALRSAFERVSGLREETRHITMQSIHGDLHLGQVLRTVGGWLLIDFEGEPAASVDERRALRSPLRDVAGMLRSFDYAAHSLLVGQEADEVRVGRAMEWTTRNREAFCAGYAAAATEELGDPREHGTLLRAFELDKAVYEVSYEHANRPDWLAVPLASIARITDGGDRT